jgi:protein O-GlcNAc transferase
VINYTVDMENKNDSKVLEKLGRTYYEKSDLKSAKKAFEQLVKIDSSPGSKGLLGVVLLETGRAEDAEAILSEAVKMAPANAVLLMNHGNALSALGRENEAALQYGAALKADPNLAEAALNLGDLLHGQGLWRQADVAWARAEAIRPGWTIIRWKRLFAPLPTLAESDAEIETCRAEFRRRLKSFSKDIPQDFTLDTVGFAQPFLLPYQGRNDSELMTLYGNLVETAAQRSLPQYRVSLVGHISKEDRMRVGFASAFFCHHSVWKIPLRGWVEGLDRKKFEVFCYHLGDRNDADTDRAAALSDHFQRGPRPLHKWAKHILNDRLHALIYPEIGMDPQTIQLAALRLAPLQAVGLGHPQTTGLSTMDTMLSSALMQPEKSSETYTEQLVPLPGIGVSYKPRKPYTHTASRSELNVEEDAVLFWCCHYISKYEPRHDTLYPAIAMRLPRARFLFLGPVRGTRGFDILTRRLEKAFGAQGLDARRHIRLLPRLPIDQFDAVSRACDFFLDNPGWSGFNSALECLATGLPVLTCRGATVRSNHAAAVLKHMGLDDCIAADLPGLADLAVYLGNDPEAHKNLKFRIIKGLQRLYRDETPVRAFEEWLLNSALKDSTGTKF